MSNNNYTRAYREVLEILKYLPNESVNKIPKEMREMFNNKMDVNYKFTIDIEKSFDEQNLLDETKAILANIFRDYWATPCQKEKIIAKETSDRKKVEEEKREKYNPNDIFKQKNYNNVVQSTESFSNSNLPIKIEKENFLIKLINFIKKMFNL